jgi:hypothetical protein
VQLVSEASSPFVVISNEKQWYKVMAIFVGSQLLFHSFRYFSLPFFLLFFCFNP